MKAVDYNVVSIAVRPGEKYTAELSGDAFAIVSGFNPRVYIARGEKEPDPKKDIRGDWRAMQVGAFNRLTFDFRPIAIVQPDIQILVIKDPRMGVVRAHVDPSDGREYRMVKNFTNGTTLPVAPNLLTLLATDELSSSAVFEEGRLGYSSDVYPSGGVVASVPFALQMSVGCGGAFMPVAWQVSRTHPYGLGADYFASLDFGWQQPGQNGAGIAPFVGAAPATQIHPTLGRVPLPVGPALITIGNLTAGAGFFGATVGTVSR